MNEDRMKDLLESYMEEEMEVLLPEEMEGYDSEPSHRFQRKMKKLFRAEKYFGKRIRMAVWIRRACACAVIVIALVTASGAGARIVGFQAWQYHRLLDGDENMEDKLYQKSNDTSEKSSAKKAMHDVPVYVPKGLKKVDYDESDLSLYVQWDRTQMSGIQYARDKIEEGTQIGMDMGYESREKLGVAGFTADYCIKGDEEWLAWEDTVYHYIIIASDIKNAKQELIKMAESIYKRQ